jgi:hypothetical protein
MVPPVERPLDFDEPDPEALSAECVDEAAACVVEGVLIMAVDAGGAVDVIITTEAAVVPPVFAGDCVMVDVTATTDGVVDAATYVVDGVTYIEDTDTVDDEVISEVRVAVVESPVEVDVVVSTVVDVLPTTLVSVTSVTLAMSC